MKFQENKLTNTVIKVKFDQPIMETIGTQLLKLGKMYSCIVYAICDDDVLKGWEIHVNISQTSKFNTLKPLDVIMYLTKMMYASKSGEIKRVVCYMQPSVELIIKLYKPLIVKLAQEQHQHWQYLEMEDLIQMCNLVICDLYYKGYYIHKRLVRRAFINYVLMHIRKEKDKPIVLSLEQEWSKTDDDDRVTIADMIPDVDAMNDMNDKDDHEVQLRILNEVKDIVIDFIGSRQYDQLLREYSNKSTTNWSRKLMTRIKAHLFEMGISSKSYDKYYN